MIVADPAKKANPCAAPANRRSAERQGRRRWRSSTHRGALNLLRICSLQHTMPLQVALEQPRRTPGQYAPGARLDRQTSRARRRHLRCEFENEPVLYRTARSRGTGVSVASRLRAGKDFRRRRNHRIKYRGFHNPTSTCPPHLATRRFPAVTRIFAVLKFDRSMRRNACFQSRANLAVLTPFLFVFDFAKCLSSLSAT
jgi:hypothetical protein